MATVDTGRVYQRIRHDFVAAVLGLSEAQRQIRVPATPAWSVRNVLAHVVGIASDLNAQRFPASDDLGGTAWTDSQVARGRGRTTADLVAEWEREAATFEDGLRAFGYEFGSHFVADLHAHYQDVRSALGLTAETDQLTVAVALDHYIGFVDGLLTANNWGELEVVTGTETRYLGRGRRRARLRARPFELLRALSGRRSEHQIRALEWHGDVDEFVGFMRANLGNGYALRERDLVE